MSRDYKLYIEDILNASDNIADYTSGLSFDAFSKDKMRVNAVERNLEIIGEAVKGIPREIRDSYPDINWRGYAGLRDILIHQYFRVNLNIVWDVVENELPLLRQEITPNGKSRTSRKRPPPPQPPSPNTKGGGSQAFLSPFPFLVFFSPLP